MLSRHCRKVLRLKIQIHLHHTNELLLQIDERQDVCSRDSALHCYASRLKKSCDTQSISMDHRQRTKGVQSRAFAAEYFLSHQIHINSLRKKPIARILEKNTVMTHKFQFTNSNSRDVSWEWSGRGNRVREMGAGV